MSIKRKDYAGQKFSRLLLVAFHSMAQSGHQIYTVLCDCGVERLASLSKMKEGQLKSCGCLNRELASTRYRDIGKRAKTHGEGFRQTAEYRCWTHIKRRCFNPKNNAYANYGGRGITVCARWKHSYKAFLEDMGRRPEHCTSIERTNNDGNYEPGNCRWATPKEQANNRRNRRWWRKPIC